MQFPRVWRSEFQNADEFILVIEGRYHQVTHTLLENFLFDSRVTRGRGQVFDDQEFPLGDGPFVERARKVCDAILRRIGADSAMFNARSGIEYKNPLSLEGRKAEEQLRLPEERAEFFLQALEAGRRNDRLFLDEIAFE